MLQLRGKYVTNRGNYSNREMYLRDVVPWSLIWGAQNERHALDNVLFGLKPGNAEWSDACEVAKILEAPHSYCALNQKPSEMFLSAMKRAGLAVTEVVTDRDKYEAWIQRYVLDEVFQEPWRQAYKQTEYKVRANSNEGMRSCPCYKSITVL